MPKKHKRRDKSDLGPDFVAPDGGWGWVVCIAAGLSNLAMYPPLQQYGMIYRQRMFNLGFSAKETTTIANIMLSLASLVGIVNGAMFRRFTFRQVAIAGSILIFSGILLSTACTTFWQYVLCVSVIYGIGQGLNVAALSLAVNTYFKNRRRRAFGFMWTITGLGPIIFPHFTTLILIYYGSPGTILIYAGISLNVFLCALTLQPVLWHTSKAPVERELKLQEPVLADSLNTTIQSATTRLEVESECKKSTTELEIEPECKYCQYMKRTSPSVVTTQFDFDDHDLAKSSREFRECEKPLISRANDERETVNLPYTKLEKQTSQKAPIAEAEEDNDEDIKDQEAKENSSAEVNHVLKENFPTEFRCTCAEERALLGDHNGGELKSPSIILVANQENIELLYPKSDTHTHKLTFKQKLVKFFDLDLLKDFTFVNLAMGMTVMMFAEINFSILVPFILDQYGYSNEQISTAMSMQGGMDICVRFLAPIVLERAKNLSNQLLFAFGIIAISLGRLLITLTDSYRFTLALFVLIGFGRGFRTIFSSLIIPSYVPLKRLPAASGLQLVCNTLFTLAVGPILGVITDASSYTMTIHFLNLLTSLALLIWLLEYLLRRMLGKKEKTQTVS
uniref:Monocarboxylate transporter 9 n=2 Tax=Bactrocera latifrons TaxID=174628 RepID=A0A0K8V207_BACLA